MPDEARTVGLPTKPQSQAATTGSRGGRWALPTFLALTACGFVWWRGWVCDDAYITFRHVSNCLAGHGPVFNVGERVQAFTHPLWFMVLLIGGAVFDLHVFAVAAGVGLTGAAMLGLDRFLRVARTQAEASPGSGQRTDPTTAPSMTLLLAATALLSSRTFVEFQTSGLETALTTLLLVVFWSTALLDSDAGGPRIGRLSFICSLVMLNRPDHLAICAPLLVGIAVSAFRRGCWGWVCLIGGLIPAIAWYGFATLYYGTPLPNTVYAKVAFPLRVSLAHGIDYVVDYAAHEPAHAAIITVSLLAGSIVSLRRAVRRQAGAWLQVCLVLGLWLQLTSVVAVGGDFMRGRFLLPTLVGCVLLGGVLLVQTARREFARGLAAILVLTPCIDCGVQAGHTHLLAGLRLGWRAVQDERFYSPVAMPMAIVAILALVAGGLAYLRWTTRERRAQPVFLAAVGLQISILLAVVGLWRPAWPLAILLAATMIVNGLLLARVAGEREFRPNLITALLLVLAAGTASLADHVPRSFLVDPRTGIADEYSFYREKRLDAPARSQGTPTIGDDLSDYGLLARQYSERYGPITMIRESLGFFSFKAADKVHVVDTFGLADAFIARCRPDPRSRVGHVEHDIPAGYLDSLGAVNREPDWKRRLAEMDPTLRLDAERRRLAATWDDQGALRRHERTRLITSGPIFARDRLRAIPQFALARP